MKLICISILGVDERTSMEGSVEYLLVLSFASGGSLTDFLRTHIIDWAMFCKMSLSIVKGLAYLHTDIRKGGMFCILLLRVIIVLVICIHFK
jgi:bone morphogenetic protein receptor type-2